MHPAQVTFPIELPLLPLKDIVIFPHMILPIFIAEEICIEAVEAALVKHKLIFLSAFSAPSSSADAPKVTLPAPFDVYDIGVIASVMKVRRLPDGRTKVLVHGLCRAKLTKFVGLSEYPCVEVEEYATTNTLQDEDFLQLKASIKDGLEKFVSCGKNIPPDVIMLFEDIHEAGKLSDVVVANLSLKIGEAQKILEIPDAFVRLQTTFQYLENSLLLNKQMLQNDKKLPAEQERSSSSQKNKAENCEVDEELHELVQRVLKSQMPLEARTETERQLKRLEKMNSESAEATLARTYIETMVELPWGKMDESPLDLSACKNNLDEDHYGLLKVKERVVEYLAVKKLNPKIKGPILCFVGPPGVGKTSLGRSIAKALGRKFARISLGGMRDEAEIRGHRRTYVGAQPGRIIQAIKSAGAMNPVLMLDELDKLGSDYKGDPASALLEILDPEQNHMFSDHYLMVPFDLSQVIFVANANRLDTIPAPLRDRLEIIEVDGYCADEKMQIAKNYIIPKNVVQHGLSSSEIQFQDSAIANIISGYTRESGLRTLEKHIATVTRKIARIVAENDEKGVERKLVKVNAKTTRDLLGHENYENIEHNTKIPRVGVATGLAYTSGGGDILELEATLVAGKGQLILTGQLGEVMRESAQTAFSYIKSKAGIYGIDIKLFSEFDVHLHAPAGAIPKDGPSAGVTITLVLLSIFTKKPIRQDVAMTGEISLLGKVLPIGGLREKCLAALRYHISIIFVPEKNRATIAELPLSLRKQLDIHYLSTVDELLLFCLNTTDKGGATISPTELIWNDNIDSISA